MLYRSGAIQISITFPVYPGGGSLLNFPFPVGKVQSPETLANTESFFENLRNVAPQDSMIFLDIA
jgi:hypothetical protein